ncbi:MAG: hypothetical protein IJR68_01705, partial [Fretibacterium sp.]|nr:hypothetical protein [Fretibacterium sp.]
MKQSAVSSQHTSNLLTRFALAAGVFVVAVLTALAPLGMFAAPAWATETSTITVGGTDYTLFTGFTATDGNGTNYA